MASTVEGAGFSQHKIKYLLAKIGSPEALPYIFYGILSLPGGSLFSLSVLQAVSPREGQNMHAFKAAGWTCLVHTNLECLLHLRNLWVEYCLFTVHAIHYLKGRSWQSDWLLPYYDYFPKTKIKLLVPERLFSQQVVPIKGVLRSDGNGGCARSATSSLRGWCFLAFVALSFVWPLMSEKVAGISASLIISDMWLALANLLKRMCVLCSRLACTHGRGISAEYFKLGI